MGEASEQVIARLIELGKVDAALARILAERKKLEADARSRGEALKKLQSELTTQRATYQARRARLEKEEKSINEEREKLTDRRKALSSLGGYKGQQAADREVEAASRQVTAREETLILAMEEASTLEHLVKGLETKTEQALSEYKALEEDLRATFLRLDERQQSYADQRFELVKGIDAKSLGLYDRVKSRCPMDPVVPLNGESCSGCFMGLGAQVKIEILRGDVVRCRGCGRILYLPPPS